MNKNKLASLFMALVVILTASPNVYADSETAIVIDGDIYTWSESVEMTVEKTDDEKIHVTCNTNEAEELYNYATVSSIFSGAYEGETVFEEQYAAIAVDMENVGNTNISVNIILTDREGNNITSNSEFSYIRETETEKIVESSGFGSIVIESGFKGTVIIPLNEFSDSESNTADFDYDSLTSWAVGMLLEGQQTAEIYINQLSWINQDIINEYGSSLGAAVLGPDSVQIPEHGESIEFFSIEGMTGNTYRFEADGYADGIVLDENGKITLDTSVEEQEIVIKATDEAGFSICKKVNLVKNWRESVENQKFNGPEDLEPVTYAFKNVEESDINLMRAVIIACCGIVFVLYVIFYIRYKAEKKREEEE